MKANKIQKLICEVVHSQLNYWSRSNDITSPTHIVDIEEECFAQLSDVITDEARNELEFLLTNLYSFIRKFDI